MATTFNVNSLPEYVEANKNELIVKAQAGGKSVGFLNLYAGVKHKEALHFLDSEIEVQDGRACGFNPGGSDTISDKEVEVKLIKIEKSYCWKDLKEKFANYQYQWEAGRETLPFEAKIAESNMTAIQNEVENIIWNGNVTVGIDGLVKQVEDSEGTHKVEFSEGQTATAKVDAMVAALAPKALAKGVRIFMSYTDFRNYVAEANASCCANRPLVDAASESMKYVGDSRIELVGILALEGTGVMVASPADELIYATDLEGASNVYRMWYDETEDMVDFRVLFALGTQIRIDDLITVGR